MISEGFEFDLIDAHYFYPDGVAAVMLGQYFRRPVTITARGSDVNVLPHYPLPRRMIRWAADRAAGLVTVSAALRQRLIELGVEPGRVTVLRNGVDVEMFRPGARDPCRREVGANGLTLLAVGNLVPLKGHDLVIEALCHLPQARLMIVGEGPQKTALQELAVRQGVADRVTFVGNVPQKRLPTFYTAADILVLASRHEGWPNVLLEAMACGTPVVVSDIPGMTEIVASSHVGRLASERSAKGFAQSIMEMAHESPKREQVRQYARTFDWASITEGQLKLFRSILESSGAASADGGS